MSSVLWKIWQSIKASHPLIYSANHSEKLNNLSGKVKFMSFFVLENKNLNKLN